jgi:cardiolipin synthase A/B
MTIENIMFWGYILGFLFVPIILVRKKHPVSAWAWCLAAIFIPYLGIFLYFIFGAFRVRRRLKPKLYHRSKFLRQWIPHQHQIPNNTSEKAWEDMDVYALKVGGSAVTDGNETKLYFDGVDAFKDKFEAIQNAKHHIHLQYFILRNDKTSRSLITLLCEKARANIEVRLLVDAIGSRNCKPLIRELREAGGQAHLFLPASFSNRFTIGLRNHRKLLVVDGKIGFMGGLNVGDEYVGKGGGRPYWRDTHMRIVGAAVLALQRSFVEDWDFAANELLTGDEYFPYPSFNGKARLQVVGSGPDQEHNASHETYFAAMTASQKRLWLSTPYLVPDSALLAALRSAALKGVDVRILTQSYPPDHWLTYWAGRYFWEDLLACGVKIFEYEKGMLHSKLMTIDSAWGCVGSANFDIRSMRLNFEINCHVHSKESVTELEAMFEEDLKVSRQVSQSTFVHRPIKEKFLENFCRLFSPLL